MPDVGNYVGNTDSLQGEEYIHKKLTCEACGTLNKKSLLSVLNYSGEYACNSSIICRVKIRKAM